MYRKSPLQGKTFGEVKHINFVLADPPKSNKMMRVYYLFLEYDVLSLPIFHHTEGLERADYIIGVDGQFLTHVWNSKF